MSHLKSWFTPRLIESSFMEADTYGSLLDGIKMTGGQ